MVFSGTGMLLTSMQVRPEEEEDFNVWFDQEHLPERVAIPGFLDARRYESVATPVRYLQVYNAVDFETLDGSAYRAALANQTEWSLHHITRFIEPTRVVGRLVASLGHYRGVGLLFIRLRPREGADMLPLLQPYQALMQTPGVLSVHFVEGDEVLSKPVTCAGPFPGSEDDYVIVECSSVALAQHLLDTLAAPDARYGRLVEASVYRFRLDLRASSLPAGAADACTARVTA